MLDVENNSPDLGKVGRKVFFQVENMQNFTTKKNIASYLFLEFSQSVLVEFQFLLFEIQGSVLTHQDRYLPNISYNLQFQVIETFLSERTSSFKLLQNLKSKNLRCSKNLQVLGKNLDGTGCS
jgi:hypothetical protein